MLKQYPAWWLGSSIAWRVLGPKLSRTDQDRGCCPPGWVSCGWGCPPAERGASCDPFHYLLWCGNGDSRWYSVTLFLLHLGYSGKCVFIYGNKHFRWADSTLLTPEEVCVWVKWIAPSFLFPCRYLKGKGAQLRYINSPAFLGRTNSVTAGARCFRHHWGIFLGPPLRYRWYQQLH